MKIKFIQSLLKFVIISVTTLIVSITSAFAAGVSILAVWGGDEEACRHTHKVVYIPVQTRAYKIACKSGFHWHVQERG